MISNTKLVNLRETPVSFFCIAVFLLEDPLRISALGDGLDRPRRSGNPSRGERNAYQMEIPKTVRFYLDSSTYWNVSYFARFVERRLSIKTSVNGEQYEFHDICLSNLYCRSKSVRKAIEKYAGQSRFDYEASRESRRYAAKIVLASIVAIIVIFICITYFSK